jgi:thiamine transport system permease protein
MAARFERRLGRQIGRSRDNPPRPLTSARQRLAAAVALAPTVLVVALPLASLIERSLVVGDGHGVDNYRALGSRDRAASSLLVPPTEAIRNSLATAVVATCTATARSHGFWMSA